MYVADQSGGAVYSFPSGRMMSNVPITSTVRIDGAYGLVLLCSSDPAFKENRVHTGGQKARDEQFAQDALNAQMHQPSAFMEKSVAYGEQGSLAIVVGVA